MKAIEIDIYRKLKTENEEMQSTIVELKRVNHDLEERLRDLHSEYMWLYYQLEKMPSPVEVLKARQEIQALKKEIQTGGCHCNKYRQSPS